MFVHFSECLPQSEFLWSRYYRISFKLMWITQMLNSTIQTFGNWILYCERNYVQAYAIRYLNFRDSVDRIANKTNQALFRFSHFNFLHKCQWCSSCHNFFLSISVTRQLINFVVNQVVFYLFCYRPSLESHAA